MDVKIPRIPAAERRKPEDDRLCQDVAIWQCRALGGNYESRSEKRKRGTSKSFFSLYYDIIIISFYTDNRQKGNVAVKDFTRINNTDSTTVPTAYELELDD